VKEITTTLNRIRANLPCSSGWERLLKGLGKTQADDEPLSYLTILEHNGLDDALWALRAEPQHERIWRHMACDFADTVRHLRPHADCTKAVQVARLYADGYATTVEMDAARVAARAAARAAAEAAAGDAAGDAARVAARYAAGDAAGYAAETAARVAARAAAEAAAANIFRHRVQGHEPIVAWGSGYRIGWTE
jgi:hypothetical protein